MKKTRYIENCTAIVVFSTDENGEHEVHGFTVVTQDYHAVDLANTLTGKKFELFHGLYGAVLKALENNGFRAPSYTDFGLTFFNICWINTDEPGNIKRYGYRESEAYND